MSEKIWKVATGDQAVEDRLAKALDCHHLVARLLVNRGITDQDEARSYLSAPLSSLHDPLLLPDMEKAVARILDAKERQEKVTIFGDYDVDGVTASAIMLRFFSDIGIDADSYIPHRQKEGYGLNVKAVEKIAGGSKLLITVDNGISAIKEVEVAKKLGLDVIITDHHLPPEKLPNAFAIINPVLEGSGYPFKGLCGAGVAFKLCMAIRSALHKSGATKESLPNLKRLLDLAAIGSVADCVPLTGENRVIVASGLGEFVENGKPGLSELVAISRIDSQQVTASDIAFRLAPRINAAGRMGDADIGLKLLTTDDRVEGRKLAIELDGRNQRRKDEQEKMFMEAEEMVGQMEKQGPMAAIVLGSSEWSSGIIGIVASKLVDKYRRPVALVSFTGSTGRGSARSIEGFHLTEALGECSDLLNQFGGHEQAAGFSMEKENLESFRVRFSEVSEIRLNEVDTKKVISIDGVASPSVFDRKLVDNILTLEPFGQSAPPPIFLGKEISFSTIRFMGDNDEHVRLITRDGKSAVGFGFGEKLKDQDIEGSLWDIVFTPGINRFNGSEKIQLILHDIRISESESS